MHKALYRTHRPQSFGEVVGQVAPTRVLRNAIMKEEFTHAYLFSGPRGTGKTSIAKILAKAVNCTSPQDGEPCGKCDNCSQSNPTDIIEIDAASNNGVDEIREIRDNVKYAPTNGRYKVYIIDEVHMLTIAAFNALLKTLEEPPKHVIFILATTEPHKVPLTIISRCQRYDFKRISIKDIVGRMKNVLEQEGVKAEDNALELIARVAQGGMRDALSLLDQAISHSEGTVTLDDVIAITGTVGLDLLTKTIELIHLKRTSEVLDIVNEIIEGGKEPNFFLEDLLTYYRDIVLYQTIGDKADLSKALLDETFIALTKKIPSSTIYGITDVLNEKLKDIRYSNQSKVLLELALVKVCQPSVAVDPLLMEEIINAVRLELGTGISSAKTQPSVEVASIQVKVEESVEPKKETIVTEENEQDEDLFSVLDEVAKGSEEANDELPPFLAAQEVNDDVPPFLGSGEQVEETPSFLDSTDISGGVPPFLDSHDSNEEIPSFLTETNGLEEFIPSSESGETADFFEMIQADIEAGAAYIEIVDEPINENQLQNQTELFVNNDQPEVNANSEEATEIFSILDKSTKEFKNEFLSKEDEFLTALKKKKLPVFKLFSCSEKVWAVSESHMVVEYTPKMKVACGNITKASNQKILAEVFKAVLGREIEVNAYTTDILKPILGQYKK